MCIICKQARRVGRAWGGMSGMAGAPKWQAPMLTAGRRGQPVPRFGKRAFLHALPHLVCGPLQHKVGLCHYSMYNLTYSQKLVGCRFLLVSSPLYRLVLPLICFLRP